MLNVLYGSWKVIIQIPIVKTMADNVSERRIIDSTIPVRQSVYMFHNVNVFLQLV